MAEIKNELCTQNISCYLLDLNICMVEVAEQARETACDGVITRPFGAKFYPCAHVSCNHVFDHCDWPKTGPENNRENNS